MSLDQLRYFLTVAEVGTTRAAADVLHISQPPVSRQIRALEDELGVALFNRSPRGMTLRPEGEVLREHARDILAAVDRAAEATKVSAVALVGRARRDGDHGQPGTDVRANGNTASATATIETGLAR